MFVTDSKVSYFKTHKKLVNEIMHNFKKTGHQNSRCDMDKKHVMNQVLVPLFLISFNI